MTTIEILTMSITANVMLAFFCWLGWSNARLYEDAWKKMCAHCDHYRAQYLALANDLQDPPASRPAPGPGTRGWITGQPQEGKP